MNKKYLLALFVIVGFTLGASPSSIAQSIGPPTGHPAPYFLDSGSIDNLTETEAVSFDHVVDMGPDVPWIRIIFAEAVLAPGSVMRVQSLFDGEVQTLDAEDMLRWRFGTAFFNGSAVRIQLVAGQNTQGNRIRIEQVVVGNTSVPGSVLPGGANLPPEIESRLNGSMMIPQVGVPETICGVDDDRKPTTNDAVARLLNDAGQPCTGSMIDCPVKGNDKCFISAGHCFDPAEPRLEDPMKMAQFDVPASDSNCDLKQPQVTKQFQIDPASIKFNNGGKGNDWAVFRTFPNSNSGKKKTAFEEQGASLELANSTVPGDVIVVGYGVDRNNDGAGGNNNACELGPPNNKCPENMGQRNNTLQVHQGPLISSSASTITYQVDTCGGNSGSPVIQESTGKVIGIHTHSGCSTGATTANTGTHIALADLDKALDSCEPQLLLLLDRTGSMNVTRPSTGNTRCADVLSTAETDVASFFSQNNNGRSKAAIWTFAGSSASPLTNDPLTNGFVGEAAALNALGTLSPTGCSGATPLAEAICDASDHLTDTFKSAGPAAGKIKTIAISSDGEENNSSGECGGPNSTSGPPYDVGSWQRAVMDKVAAQNVILSRLWGTFTQSVSGTDPETGLIRDAETAIDDLIFFQELARVTGGIVQIVGDSDPLPPPITGPLLGDANGDGLINALDLVATANDILGIVGAPGNADCNGGGTVNVLDLVCIGNLILGL